MLAVLFKLTLPLMKSLVSKDLTVGSWEMAIITFSSRRQGSMIMGEDALKVRDCEIEPLKSASTAGALWKGGSRQFNSR